MGFLIDAGIAVAFAVLLVWAGWGDLRTYRISNRLVAAFFCLFVAAFAVGPNPWTQIIGHLGAGILALALGLFLFWRNWIGGGDAKLFAVLAVWAGWPDLIRLTVVMALAGGVLSALRLWQGRGASEIATEGESRKRREVPYGVAIALAGLDFWLRRLAAPAWMN